MEITIGKRVVHLDESDAHLLTSEWPWSVMVQGTTRYLRRSRWDGNKVHMEYFHRIVLSAPPGSYVDHINGNGLDNRRANLRLATHSQNLGNRGKTKRNTSGYKGVSWHKQRARWRAIIQMNNKQYHLGLFDCPEEAHQAYKKAADKLYGEFSNHG